MKNRPSLLDIETFNKNREQDLEQEPSVLGEGSNTQASREPGQLEVEIMSMIKTLQSEMDTNRRELAKAMAQLQVHKELLDKQDKEIALLKEELHKNIQEDEASDKVRRADVEYNREQIVQNIATLIEEKGFSFNDVARLFKLEGFRPPPRTPNGMIELLKNCMR